MFKRDRRRIAVIVKRVGCLSFLCVSAPKPFNRPTRRWSAKRIWAWGGQSRGIRGCAFPRSTTLCRDGCEWSEPTRKCVDRRKLRAPPFIVSVWAGQKESKRQSLLTLCPPPQITIHWLAIAKSWALSSLWHLIEPWKRLGVKNETKSLIQRPALSSDTLKNIFKITLY